MPNTHKVDISATWTELVFLASTPKADFETKIQTIDKNTGLPKWDVQVQATFIGRGDSTQFEVIKIGVPASVNPADSIARYTPLELSGLEIGTLNNGNVWYRAAGINSVATTSSNRRSASAES